MTERSTPSAGRTLLAFVLGATFFCYAFVHRVAPSVMTDELMDAFAVGGSALGCLSALYFYAYVAMQMPVGMMMDRYSPRGLMTAALLVCSAASLWLASTDSLLAALVSRALIGGSVAFAFVGTLAIVSRWFAPASFALLAGIAQASGMLGAVIGQAPQRLLVEHYGWRGATLVLAAIGLLLALLVYWIVPAAGQLAAVVGRDHKETQPSVFRYWPNWVCAIAGFGLAAPMLGFAALWSVPWLVATRGLAQTEAAAIASLVFVGWMLGAPLAGWMSDRARLRKPVLLCGAVVSLLVLVLILKLPVSNPLLLSSMFLVQGLGGGVMAVLYGTIRELNPIQRGATAIAMLNTVVVGSGALMQPLIGKLLDGRWSGALSDGARIYDAANYGQAFNWLIVMNLIALLALLCLPETRCRQVQ